jgi:integrase
MRALINSKLLIEPAAQPARKPFEICDTRLSGFVLRVQPTGVRSFYARFGRNRRFALGRADVVDAEDARINCQRILGNIAHGRDPLEGLSGTAGLTLGQFITDSYAPWVSANRPRTATDSLDKLERHFGSWYAEPLSAITVERLELWKGRRLNGGCKPITLLRDLFTLSSVLTRAVRMGKLGANPIRKVEKPRIDRGPKVRFLDAAEESRLRFALRARDAQLRLVRTSANQRRLVRRESVLPPLLHFGDHLTPAVLISMNTGLRLGETLKLRWKNVHLDRRWLTVEGREAKSRQTRHVPLNAEAVNVLTQWREQSGSLGRVFNVTLSFKTAWWHLLERADIQNFRWHDLRHHFASRLVQAGVPLNTVRDLLGHSSVVMSLRYAHLAPDQRCEAVAKLGERPVMTATIKLPSEAVFPMGRCEHSFDPEVTVRLNLPLRL